MIRLFLRDKFLPMAGPIAPCRRGYPTRDWMMLMAVCMSFHARQTLADELACKPQGGAAGRPAIGIVLSGGGARGYAHLGVLQVLEENRIPLDCIAGTSMGAVVGGLYASGMSAAELQRRMAQINLVDITFDVNERADPPQLQREDERSYVSNLSFGFGGGRFKLPAGLVQGNRFQALLQDLTSTIPGNLPFDALPICAAARLRCFKRLRNVMRQCWSACIGHFYTKNWVLAAGSRSASIIMKSPCCARRT